LKETPHPKKTNQCAFVHLYKETLYEWYAKREEKAIRFAAGQHGTAKFDTLGTVLEDWVTQQKTEGKRLVDVGGGQGHITIPLVEKFSGLSVVVQDINVNQFIEAEQNLNPTLRDRVSFEQYDYRTEQPLQGGVLAFFLRHVLHNWADPEAIEIIRAHIPALKASPETVLLLNETVVPERHQVSAIDERPTRVMDINMMIYFNAKQRSAREWHELVQKADPNLKVTNITMETTGATVMGLIEVRYQF